jgi:hypothetical protein
MKKNNVKWLMASALALVAMLSFHVKSEAVEKNICDTKYAQEKILSLLPEGDYEIPPTLMKHYEKEGEYLCYAMKMKWNKTPDVLFATPVEAWYILKSDEKHGKFIVSLQPTLKCDKSDMNYPTGKRFIDFKSSTACAPAN